MIKVRIATGTAAALLASWVICAVGAAPARAEVPSLNAYAGEALVLGSPHQKHRPTRHAGRTGKGGGGEAAGEGKGSSAGGGSGSSGGGSGPSNRGSGSSSGAATGGGAGTESHGANPQPSVANGAKGSGQSAGSSSHGGGAGHGSASKASGVVVIKGAAGASGVPAPTTYPQSTGSWGSLSGTDVLLLIVGLMMLLGIATALRRTRVSH